MVDALAVIGGVGIIMIMVAIVCYAFLVWLSWEMRQ